jgi:uncharacterized membrane protein
MSGFTWNITITIVYVASLLYLYQNHIKRFMGFQKQRKIAAAKRLLNKRKRKAANKDDTNL